MRVCLFEDLNSEFGPLVCTRPVFDLLCGQTSLAVKQLRAFPASEIGVLIRPSLADLYQQEHPESAVNDEAWLTTGRTLLINGRWLPDSPRPLLLHDAENQVGCIGSEVAFALVGPTELQDCSSASLSRCLENWQHTLPCWQVGGKLVAYPWDLVHENGRQLAIDFVHAGLSGNHPAQPVTVIGPTDQLYVDPSADIDPAVVADTRGGPVFIDRNAVIRAFTRLEGPCYIGPYTQVKAAQIHAGSTLGPQCRIGGEVEASIVHGYSNKAHDGFLGHSYLGEWVNLGAGTQTSDLRNDYGKVSVTLNSRQLPTGLMKVGSIIGDHTKTALGTLLNTGSNVGIFCNLLPAGGLAPNNIPSFSNWWKGQMREGSDLVRLFTTAKEVMRRRGRELTELHRAVYQRVWHETAAERRQVFHQMDMRSRRQSA